MKPRVTGEAVIPAKVRELIDKFEYPVDLPLSPSVDTGGGGGMAHLLIVSTSEPSDIQDKADYIVPSSNSSQPLQTIFDSISGAWTIWMAGIFDLDGDVTAPSACFVRGLGYLSGSV